MFKIDQDILARAVCTYGAEPQIRKAQEECGELIGALQDHLARPTAETIKHVNEEVADVLIMAHQLAMIFSPFGVHRQIDYKMKRLEGRLALGGAVQVDGKGTDKEIANALSENNTAARG